MSAELVLNEKIIYENNQIEADIMTPNLYYFSKSEEKKPSKSPGEKRSLELGARTKKKTELPVSSSPGRLSSHKK